MINIKNIMEEIKNRIRWDELNDDIGVVPKWFKNKNDNFPYRADYEKCFCDGLNCQQYTDQRIVSDVLEKYVNVNDDGWIFCNEHFPTVETEVLIVANRKYKGGDSQYIITTAMYEDGTVLENDSCWNWEDIEGEWDEENDCYIIPEGWWENRHYNPDEVYNNVVDDEVIAWQYLPQFCDK